MIVLLCLLAGCGKGNEVAGRKETASSPGVEVQGLGSKTEAVKKIEESAEN